jgi:uncharacterized protein YukE
MTDPVGESLPSLSQIENLDTRFLGDGADYWEGLADQIDNSFTAVSTEITKPAGSVWEGQSADAAQRWADRARGNALADAARLREAAKIARLAADSLHAAKDRVMDAVIAAENDGFAVHDDCSVTDTRTYDYESMADAREEARRAAKAKEHADYIRYRVGNFVQLDKIDTERLLAATAGLGDDAASTDGQPGRIQSVDHHWKQGGPAGAPPRRSQAVSRILAKPDPRAKRPALRPRPRHRQSSRDAV